MNYIPQDEALIDIVEGFNKRNDTYISYLRNQYNALENYVHAYCNDNKMFLVGRTGDVTGINYKFRNVLCEVILSKNEAVQFLNSRGVNTLFHFVPLIHDDDSGSTLKHESFQASYEIFKQKPNDLRAQRKAIGDLCGLLYLVRCNVAHTGKSNRGPNREKIERDMAIAKLVTDINRSIFNIIMDHPEKKLVCYGTLENSIYVNNMRLIKGKVKGYLDYDSNGIAYFTYELNTGTVDVKLYINSNTIDFKDMDDYEGDSYERVYIPVDCNGKTQIANIYERKYSYE